MATNDPSPLEKTSGSDDSAAIQAGAPPQSNETTAIQAGAPQTESSIPLAPIEAPAPEPITPEELAGEIRRLDWVLGFLVLMLAFFLASFPVRNTDFWHHLAQGRLYAHGHFDFGKDPFIYTQTNYWTNHSWLYDAIVYGLATVAGGAATPVGGAVLVVLKALLVTLLSWVMLKVRRPGVSLWAPAACTALALVAMSPRLLFQPALLSALFLAVTLYTLQRPRHDESSLRNLEGVGRSPLSVYWYLPLLFAFWVNLDSWWFLGPATVLLFLIGQALQQFLAPIRTGEDAPEPHQLRTLCLVLVAGLAAGLVNPHHYHAFTLPAQLSPWTPLAALEGDRTFKFLFLSPLDSDYYIPGLGWNVAGLAYFPLAGIGLLSFVLTFFAGAWRWWRFLVWLGFAALSAYQARAVPFFAVLSGPISALNFQDFTVASFGEVPRVERAWKAWSLGGRVLTALAAVLLLAAVWPGWLHGRPTDARQLHRVGWQVSVDDSLRKTAEQVRAWRTQGLLKPEEQGFNFSPDIANYLAWFGADDKTGLPSEKAYMDYRIELFPADTTRKYVDIRKALIEQNRARDSGSRPINWPEVFRKQNINHVILSTTDRDAGDVWPQLLQDWSQWSLVALVDGRAWVFSWNDPLKRTAAAEARLPRFSANAAAFGPAAQAQATAPETAPAAPQPQDLFGRYLRGSPAHPAEADEALSYVAYFEIVRGSWYRPYLVSKEFADMTAAVVASGTSPATSTAALPVTKIASIPVTLALQGRPDGLTYALFGTDYGPPGAPLLAVRAARKAIQASPGDPQAYVTLALAYSTLWREQEEHWTGQANYGGMPRMARQQLRHIQMTTALEQAVKLRPDDASARLQLFQIYGTLNYLDLALEHFQEYVNLLAPGPNESQEDFNKRADPLRTALKNLETRVGRERNQFELEQTNKRPLEKAVLAQRKGLTKRALQVLLQADPSQMERDAIDMEVRLLLTTGASAPDVEHGLDDVRQMLDGIKFGLGLNYELYAFWLEAAAGDYQKADEYISAAIGRLEKNCTMMVLDAVRAQTFTGDRLGRVQEFTYWLQNIKMIAEYKVMQAMVEMEAGNVAAAARHCEEALNLNNGQPFDFDSKMIAVHYLKQIRNAGGAK